MPINSGVESSPYDRLPFIRGRLDYAEELFRAWVQKGAPGTKTAQAPPTVPVTPKQERLLIAQMSAIAVGVAGLRRVVPSAEIFFANPQSDDYDGVKLGFSAGDPLTQHILVTQGGVNRSEESAIGLTAQMPPGDISAIIYQNPGETVHTVQVDGTTRRVSVLEISPSPPAIPAISPEQAVAKLIGILGVIQTKMLG